MDVLSGVATLAPTLATLGRSKATGVLCWSGPHSNMHLRLQQGRAVSLAMPDRRVGVAQTTLLERRLLRHHLEVAMRGGAVTLRYRSNVSLDCEMNAEGLPKEGPCAASLGLRVVRRICGQVPVTRARAMLGAPDFALRATGLYLLEHGAVFPREAAMLRLMTQAGEGSVDACLACGGAGPEAIRSLLALRFVGAVGPHTGPYALLLRKHRQLRDGESLDALLDIRRGAGRREANRAFRRIASALHPDQIGSSAPEAAVRISERVIDGLCRAHAARREHHS